MPALNRKRAASAERSQNKAQSHSCPAPIGGLNTRDAESEMPETDALIADNVFCQPTWVDIPRGGHKTLATFSGNAETVMAYNGLAAAPNRLYAAINNTGVRSIFRVDNAGGGSAGAAVVGGAGNTIQAITSTLYDFAQFGTGSVNALYLVNGVDPPLYFDGTAWVSITTVSTPALTGGPTLSTLKYIAVYKQRLWFVQAGTFNVYYLPQNVVGGALALINMGPNFKLGGFLVSIITVSIDNSNGSQDYIAFVSNQGEIVMFQGFNPADATNWSMAAHFVVGRPIGTGRQMWQKMGEDAAIICADGVLLLSQAMLTDRSQTRNTLTDKIRFGINQQMALYASFQGWELRLYPDGNKLILNVPTSAAAGTSFQYVMNMLNGSWSTWGLLASPLNAFSWEVSNGLLYYGTAGSVEQADLASLGDNNAPITVTLKPAFNYMGERTTQKRFSQLQALFKTNGGLNISLSFSGDFDPSMPSQAIQLSQNTAAAWGSSLWNTTLWGDTKQVVKKWIGFIGAGYCAAPFIQASVLNLNAQFETITYMYEEGGTFYGR